MPYLPLPSTYGVSKFQGKLWFDGPQVDASYFEHDFGDYALEARISYNQKHELPWVLSVHGARADFTKSDAVTQRLQARGYSVLAINLSGHSPAGVLQLEQTSLQANITETETFFCYLDPARPKVVIGYSMGGTDTLKLLEDHAHEIDKLILFYPGIYAKQSYKAHFGEDFRTIISEPFSYRDNDTIELLRAFKGELLLIKGEYDGLDPVLYGKPAGTSAGEIEIDGRKHYSPIPKEVLEMIYDAVPEDRRQLIEVPGCDHSIVMHLQSHPEAAESFLEQIDTFLQA